MAGVEGGIFLPSLYSVFQDIFGLGILSSLRFSVSFLASSTHTNLITSLINLTQKTTPSLPRHLLPWAPFTEMVTCEAPVARTLDSLSFDYPRGYAYLVVTSVHWNMERVKYREKKKNQKRVTKPASDQNKGKSRPQLSSPRWAPDTEDMVLSNKWILYSLKIMPISGGQTSL